MKSRRRKGITGARACMAALLALQVCLTAFGGEGEEKNTEEPTAFTILPDQVPTQKYRGGRYEVDVYGGFTQLKDETGAASIVEDSRLLMKRGSMIAVPAGMSYLNGRVDQVVVDSISGSDGEARYLSVLEDDYRIEDYYEELKWPDKLSNSGIKEISRTLDTSDTVLMVRYTDNTVAAFNYVTGNLIFKDESEKQPLSFGEYVGNWFSEKWNNLFGPSTLDYDEIKFLEKELEGKPVNAELTGVLAGNGQNLSSADQVVYNLKGQKTEEGAETAFGQGTSDLSSDTWALEKHMAASGATAPEDITDGIHAPEGTSGIPGSDTCGENGVLGTNQDAMAAQTGESALYPGDINKGQEPAGEGAGETGYQGAAGAEAALGQTEGIIPGGQPAGSDGARAEGEARETDPDTDTAAVPGDSSVPLVTGDAAGAQASDIQDDNQEGDGSQKTDDGADGAEEAGADGSQKADDGADGETDSSQKTDDGAEDAEEADTDQSRKNGAGDGAEGSLKPDEAADAEAGGEQAPEAASDEDTGVQEISLEQFLPVFNPETGEYELYDTQEYLSQRGVKGNILNISENFGRINGGSKSSGLLGEVSGWIGYGAVLMGIIMTALFFLRRAIDKKLQI